MKNTTTIPLLKFESKVPVIKITVGDRDLYALLDTGSESTLMDENLVKEGAVKSKKIDRKISFVGLGGGSEKIDITIASDDFQVTKEDKIHIAGISTDMSRIASHFRESYGSEIVLSAVLGCDFLDSYNAVIDFDNHTLTVQL